MEPVDLQDPPRRFPSASDGLRLSVSVNDTLLTPADTLTVTISLANTGADSVRLTFPSSCQAMPRILAGDGDVRIPPSGSWTCFDGITHLALASGAVAASTLSWAGGPLPPPPGGRNRLPEGPLWVGADMVATGLALEAEYVLVRVRAP